MLTGTDRRGDPDVQPLGDPVGHFRPGLKPVLGVHRLVGDLGSPRVHQRRPDVYTSNRLIKEPDVHAEAMARLKGRLRVIVQLQERNVGILRLSPRKEFPQGAEPEGAGEEGHFKPG